MPLLPNVMNIGINELYNTLSRDLFAGQGIIVSRVADDNFIKSPILSILGARLGIIFNKSYIKLQKVNTLLPNLTRKV